jgi:hypothetical protein
MRLSLAASLAGIVLALPLALAACGDETGVATDEPTTGTSSTPTDSPSLEARPYQAQKTCAQLYRPPAQLMPRAIELVHGSPSAEAVTAAVEIADGLAEAEAHALDPLAEDIAVVIAGVQAVGSGETPDVAAFDKAANGLGRNCELYND